MRTLDQAIGQWIDRSDAAARNVLVRLEGPRGCLRMSSCATGCPIKSCSSCERVGRAAMWHDHPPETTVAAAEPIW